MKIRRTANAGVLLNLDHVKILLDGVCREVAPYLATPQALQQQLLADLPDVAVFTHIHPDHFDPDFARSYISKTGRSVIAPRDAASELPGWVASESSYQAGPVRITAVSTRHMGKSGATVEHQSYVIQGSRCVWFPGDASPTQLHALARISKPDVMILPFPYLSTPASIQMLQPYLPCSILLVHMPRREQDPYGIWQAVSCGTDALGKQICYLDLGESTEILH